MDKHICHGIMAIVLALCIAAMVQPGESQLAPESQLFIPIDGSIPLPPEALASEKFFKNLFSKEKWKARKEGFKIGRLIADCLGNYDEVKECVAEVQEVFINGDVKGLTGECCDALTGIAEDCLSAARNLPQVRGPVLAITAYCKLFKTLEGYFG